MKNSCFNFKDPAYFCVLCFSFFRAVSSVGLEHHVDNVRVAGSNPAQPTTKTLTLFYLVTVEHTLVSLPSSYTTNRTFTRLIKI